MVIFEELIVGTDKKEKCRRANRKIDMCRPL